MGMLAAVAQTAVAKTHGSASKTHGSASHASLVTCEKRALGTPSALKARYVGRLLNPHTIRVSGRLASLPGCAKFGTRVVSLVDVQVQQEHKISNGFGKGRRVWKSGPPRGVTLSSGDGKRSFKKSVKTSLNLYCYRTAAHSDGVNSTRVRLRLAFHPSHPHAKPRAKTLTKAVGYKIGFC